MRRILLVEPGYRNKYPPLGLMKISTYHKLKGDYVQFVKGCDDNTRNKSWDRIYISTLFTFFWKKTVDTIIYYTGSVDNPKDIFVGGVMATLLKDELNQVVKATIISGLIDKPGMLDIGDRHHVDTLIPDYSILEQIDYKYGLNDAYIGYATRGCPNRCGFCAVRKIEPEFCDYLPLKKQVQAIEEIYGAKQNLVLFDNNVMASNQYERIIDDIIELGFGKGATFGKKSRHVDFNQGVDLRLLTRDKMMLLSKIAIKPLRLAFDHIKLKDEYIDRIRLAVECGITNLSNYVLFNYHDTPEDFYERLRINVELNKELGTHIYSFPMKFIPLDAKDRSYVGKNWNRRLLRGIQCILLATKGSVGTNTEFFYAAFGRTPEEFLEIAMMPEDYIIHRQKHMDDGASDWHNAFIALSETQRIEFMNAASANKPADQCPEYANLLSHYEKKDVN